MDYSASQTEHVPTGVVTGSPLPSSLDTSASSPLPPQVISTSSTYSPFPVPQQVISTSTASSIPHPPPPPPVLGISQVYRAPPAAPNLGLRKVLVVLSSQSTLHLRNNKLQQTGTFLSELVRPLESILKSGFQPVFATPLGESSTMLPPPIDPMSDSFVWFGGSRLDYDEAKSLLDRLAVPTTEGSFSKPRKFSSFNEVELQEFVGILVPGGHAPLIDLYKDSDLGRILCHFHHFGKPTGVICHGVAALLSAGITNLDDKQSGKPSFSMRIDWPYAGYHMTCYSDREEKLNELMWRDKVPFLLETTLRKSGAVLDVRSIPFLPNVIQYKELVSAQGPTSSSQFGSTFKDALIRFNNSHLSGTSTASASPVIAYPPASVNAYASPSSSDFAKKRSTEELPSYQNVGSMATEVVTPNNR